MCEHILLCVLQSVSCFTEETAQCGRPLNSSRKETQAEYFGIKIIKEHYAPCLLLPSP